MLAIVGILVVLLAVLGGYLIEGGSFLVLMHFAEFIIIGGAAAGALLISTPPKLLKKILNRALLNFKKSKVEKETYLGILPFLRLQKRAQAAFSRPYWTPGTANPRRTPPSITISAPVV